jgi:hypothetical protein
MACPHVSGVAALLVQKSEQELGYVDTYKIKKSIELGAKDILAPGFDIDSGYGRVDCVDALAVDFSLIPDAYNLILNFTTASEISDKVESLKYLENVCGVFVTLKNEAGATPPYIAKTNYDGSIEFTDIPAGDYKLYAGVADPTIPALSLVNLLSLENRSAAFYGFNDSISVNGDTEENYSLSNKPALIIDNVEGNFDSLKIALFENFSESEVASKTFDNLPSVNTFNFPADGFAGWYDYYLERTNTTGSATVTGKIRYNNDSSRDISFEFVFGDGEAGSLDPEDDYYVSEGFYVAM